MVTLDTIKRSLKIDYTADDGELLRLRDAVVALIEEYTGLSLCPKKVTQYLGGFTRARVEHAPFISVDSVRYTSIAGTVVTMPTTDWFLIRKELPTVYLDFRTQPPIKEGTEIEVTLTCGYAKATADIEHAIIALVATFYENPGSTTTLGATSLPMGAEFILSNLKVKGALS
jgi:uncharacterized phiE125 gp8 family phage protein